MNCPKCGANISKLECDNCGFVFNSDRYTFLDVKNRQEMRAFAEFIRDLTEPESLEVRIGKRISESVSEEELAEFDALTDKEEVAKWLEKHVPNYRQIIMEEEARDNDSPRASYPIATSQTSSQSSNVNRDSSEKEREEHPREATYEELRKTAKDFTEQERAAWAVVQLIEDIPMGGSSLQARAAYDALTPMARQWVSNYEKLIAEETRAQDLHNNQSSISGGTQLGHTEESNSGTENGDDKDVDPSDQLFQRLVNMPEGMENQSKEEHSVPEQDDRAAVERVSQLIEQIDVHNIMLTDECAQQIHDARWAYNALTVRQRSLLNNYNRLRNAEQEYRRLESEAEGKRQKRKTRIRTFLIIALIAVIGSFACFIMTNRNKANETQKLQTPVVYNLNEDQNAADLSAAQRGDRILFGRYEQDNIIENGTESLEWIVLRKESDAILVSTLYCIDDKAYNDGDDWTGTSWEGCSLRSWLNNDFLNTAFTGQEQDNIGWFQLVATDGEGNPVYDDIIIDRVSLLGMTDIVALFPDYEYAHAVTFYDKDNNPFLTTSMSTSTHPSLATTYTEYARSQHLINEAEANGENAAQRYQTNTEAEYGRGTSNWWLRDEGYEEYSAMEIIWNGAAISVPAHAHVGVRPAIWIIFQ